MLRRRDQQQFLSEVHLHQVPSVDSAKLLNVEKNKIKHTGILRKINCGATTNKTEKDITV